MRAHPCRWKYSLVEEQRPGQYYPVEEDDRGTYIMNSKDLCLIEHLPELIGAGIESFKNRRQDEKRVIMWRQQWAHIAGLWTLMPQILRDMSLIPEWMAELAR